MLAIILVMGSISIRMCKLYKVLKRSSEEFLFFQEADQASGQSFDIGSRDQSTKQIHGYRDLGVINSHNI